MWVTAAGGRGRKNGRLLAHTDQWTNRRPSEKRLAFSRSLQLSQLAWRRRMTRKAPVPSRPAAATAMAMLGPVVASADFVGVVRGAATAGVEDGLAGVPVAVTVLVVALVVVVAGADGVGVAAGAVVSVAGGATGAAGVVSVVGVDDVVSGVGCGAGVSDGGVSFVVVVVVLVVVVVVLLVVLVVWVSVVLLTL